MLRAPLYRDLEDYILNFSRSLIFLSRFLTQVGPTVNILAGLTSVSYKRFYTLALIGERAYVTVYVSVGFFLGSQWENSLGFLLQGGIVNSLDW